MRFNKNNGNPWLLVLMVESYFLFKNILLKSANPDYTLTPVSIGVASFDLHLSCSYKIN